MPDRNGKKGLSEVREREFIKCKNVFAFRICRAAACMCPINIERTRVIYTPASVLRGVTLNSHERLSFKQLIELVLSQAEHRPAIHG